nr:unnamed protein product [Callosobruchus chinensis]
MRHLIGHWIILHFLHGLSIYFHTLHSCLTRTCWTCTD